MAREAVVMDAPTVVHQSVESSLAQQYEAHRQRTPEAPQEYTGLAGIGQEVDEVMRGLASLSFETVAR